MARRKSRKNPDPVTFSPWREGRVFVRLPAGTKTDNPIAAARVLSATGKAVFFWLGDGNAAGYPKKIYVCMFPENGLPDVSTITANKSGFTANTEEQALARLRSGSYMPSARTSTYDLYLVTKSGNNAPIAQKTPWVVDRYPLSSDFDHLREAAGFPLVPAGVSARKASRPVPPYGPSPMPFGWGYPPPATPTPSPFDPFATAYSPFYASTGITVSNEEALDRALIDAYHLAGKHNQMGPAILYGYDGPPRKNNLVTQYVGLTPLEVPPMASFSQNWRGIDAYPDEIDPDKFHHYVPWLQQQMIEEAKKEPDTMASLRKAKKLEMLKQPGLIQWRILAPVIRGDIRYYLCQWKFMGEPARYEVDDVLVSNFKNF